MTDEQTKINEAFEKCLSSYLSKEAKKQISEIYGAKVAAEVTAIYDDALSAPVNWRTATIDSALPILHELLDRKYPWLSGLARQNINYSFIMEWK